MKKILLIIICLTFYLSIQSGEGGDINEVAIVYKDVEIPDTILKTIIFYEGFSATPYKLDNHTYIGYGHLITNSNAVITKIEAEISLKNDLTKLVNYFRNKEKFNKQQILALSMLAYNCGVYKVINYPIYKKILNNEFPDKWIDYCYFNNKKHKKLSERRKFELLIYTNNLKL